MTVLMMASIHLEAIQRVRECVLWVKVCLPQTEFCLTQLEPAIYTASTLLTILQMKMKDIAVL